MQRRVARFRSSAREDDLAGLAANQRGHALARRLDRIARGGAKSVPLDAFPYAVVRKGIISSRTAASSCVVALLSR